MKLGAIRLSEVGHFASGVALEGLSGGLDVLAGPNEMGKSTLFRAIELAFRERYTSTKAEISALAPAGGGAPLIEIDFEAAGSRWRLRKRYLSARTAELTDLASGTRLRGADAETRLERLVAGRLDRSLMLGLLWVGQQESLDLPKDAKGDIRQTLGALIEDEIADAAGDGLARHVREAVAAALDGLVSKAHKRPAVGKPYKAAIDARDQAAIVLQAADHSAALARHRLDSLKAAQAEAVALSAPDAKAARDGVLSRLRAACAEADRAIEEVKRADLEVKVREGARDRARAAQAHLLARLDERARLDAVVTGAASELAGAQSRLDAATTARVAVETRLDVAREQVAMVEGEVARYDLGVRQRGLQDVVAGLGQKLRDAEAVEVHRAVVDATDCGPPITVAAVDELRRCSVEIDRLEARLAAVRAKVRIDYVPGAEGRLVVGGVPLITSGDIASADHLAIEIAGIGVVTIASAVAGTQDHAALNAARDRLAAALAAANVSGVEAAVARLAANQQRAAESLALHRQLDGIAPKGVDELRRRFDAATAELAATGGAIAPASMDRGRLIAHLEELRREIAVLDQQARRLGAEILACSTGRATVAASAAAARQRLGVLDEQDAAASPGDDDRAQTGARVQECETALNAALRDRTAWHAVALAPAARAALDHDLAMAVRTSRAVEQRQQQIAIDIRGFEGALERDRQDGVEAAAEEARAAFDAAEARVGAFEAQVAELQLLHQLLAEEAAAARAAELKPVLERLKTYAAGIFPGASFEFHDKLVVGGLLREGAVTSQGRLSGGTSEQIAVLVRLAYARLLADRGEALPLVLDDALVYADHERFQAMLAALGEAARHHQVIMLTCHPERLPTAAAPGLRRLELSPWSPG